MQIRRPELARRALPICIIKDSPPPHTPPAPARRKELGAYFYRHWPLIRQIKTVVLH